MFSVSEKKLRRERVLGKVPFKNFQEHFELSFTSGEIL